MKKHRRKLLSALLALALFTTTVPVAPVMAAQESDHTQTLPAEDGTGDQPLVDVGDTNEPTGSVADKNQYWDKEGDNWEAKPIPDRATEIPAENPPMDWTANGENEGWYIVKSDVTIGSRVSVEGDVHLILADGASLTVNGGIQVQDANKLTIYAQSTGDKMGTLTATGGENAAGIGGSNGRCRW